MSIFTIGPTRGTSSTGPYPRWAGSLTPEVPRAQSRSGSARAFADGDGTGGGHVRQRGADAEAAGGRSVGRRARPGRSRSAQPARGQAARAARGGRQRGPHRPGQGRRSVNGSTVVKVGETAGRDAPASASGRSGPARQTEDQYVELARETTDQIFVILAEFGDERHPSYPDQDTDPDTAGPDPVRRSAAQRDPRAQPARWTTPPSGRPDYSAGPLPPALLRRPGRATSRSRPTTRPSPPAGTASTARSPTG